MDSSKEELETFSFWRRKIKDLNLSVGILIFLKKCPLKYSLIFWIGCAISDRKLNSKFSNLRLLNNDGIRKRTHILQILHFFCLRNKSLCIVCQASKTKALLFYLINSFCEANHFDFDWICSSLTQEKTHELNTSEWIRSSNWLVLINTLTVVRK